MMATTKRNLVAVTLLLGLCAASARAQNSISLNFRIGTDDNNSVDAGETAIAGIPGTVNVDGSVWNNVTLLNSGTGAPTVFTAATQGGNSINLVNSMGANAATLASSGAFFSNVANATDGAALGSTGESGLMQSYLLANNNESVTISGLSSDFTDNGYTVYAMFDVGIVNRTYGLAINEGAGGNGVSAAFFTNDTIAIDSDANEDGLMEWVQAVGTAAGMATGDANFIVFEGLTADSFTISGADGNRAAFSGLQIVANPAAAVPEPSSVALWIVAGAMAIAVCLRRRASR